MTKCTNAQLSALKWLINRGGDGVFARGPVLLAQGEEAPVMRATWSRLETAEFVESYGKRRLKVTDKGRTVDLSQVAESYGENGT